MIKTKPSVVHPFDPDCIKEWSVVKYGVTIYVNRLPLPEFRDGVSLDVEHDGNGKFVGIGFYDGEACYYYSDWELARQLIIPKFIAHSGINDIQCLRHWGFKVDNSFLLHDTMLFQHVIDSSQRDYGLKSICLREFGVYWPDYKEIVKVGKGWKTLLDFPVEAVSEYNSCDTYWCYQLYLKQIAQEEKSHNIRGDSMMYYYDTIEKPCSEIFNSMEQTGIRIDLNYLEGLKTYLEEQKQPIEQEIKNELGNINLASPKQVLEALHEKEIYPEFKGKPSTDKRGSISRMEGVRVVDALMSFSELDTLLCSFIYPYLERKQEVVHCRFNQVGTRTGRPSCSNPNLLQIPKRTEYGKLVRRMFIAREGYTFGDCDYGQIEPRLLAHLSKDENMCKMFRNGVDFHSFTSDNMAISRDRAKILNLSVGYRATFKSVSQQLKCSDTEAQTEIDRWWSMFPQLREWQDKLIYSSKRDGYCTTLMGRRIKVDGLGEYNKWKREHAQRILINNITQASAAEIMKLAMIKVYDFDVNILVQVYDSLLLECKQKYAVDTFNEIKEVMENTTKLDIPLTVSLAIGENWGNVRELE